MSAEHGPTPQEMGQDRKEVKETLPSEIAVYAIEETRTQNDNVTKQGFGYSTPLKSPLKSSRFTWEGKLHQSREDVANNSMSQDDIEALAENFAYNYRAHQNPDLQKKGKASYSFNFEPSPEAIDKFKKQNGTNSSIRGLNPEERKRFIEAFRKANQEAARKK